MSNLPNNSFLYIGIEETVKNKVFIDALRLYSEQMHSPAYLISKPLLDSRYKYEISDSAFLVLVPKRKLVFVNNGLSSDGFKDYCQDFVEDLGSISDRFHYREWIGRPRMWKEDLIAELDQFDEEIFEKYLHASELQDPVGQRKSELLISLLIGSINDVQQIGGAEVPQTILGKIKKKIVLFDSDQTRFVYDKVTMPVVRIQGLSGTGKTELLLHKLKELYTESSDSRIAFTCHSKVLANDLAQRIPRFFDAMQVAQQVLWNDRLWCTHAWGSSRDENSGIYRKICEYYGIQFERYQSGVDFGSVCKRAKEAIEAGPEPRKLFHYMLIDESQDFADSFFDLCTLVTEKTIYIAGDIFQSIFDRDTGSKESTDFLLSKVYRTDPRTLMFGHALGMGLFEDEKQRWLDDDEWEKCGYIVNREDDWYRLGRVPLRRFEDINSSEYTSVSLEVVNGPFYDKVGDTVLSLIKEICEENSDAKAEDIGIIFLDTGASVYSFANRLESKVVRELGWTVNKAYETKEKSSDSLFISNRNNVKGLEFPFVICITACLQNNRPYRNALYMAITRSFLKTYLVLSGDVNGDTMRKVEEGLKIINTNGEIVTREPGPEEKTALHDGTRWESALSKSLWDVINELCDENDVMETSDREKIRKMVSAGEYTKDQEDKIRYIVRLIKDESKAENR